MGRVAYKRRSFSEHSRVADEVRFFSSSGRTTFHCSDVPLGSDAIPGPGVGYRGRVGARNPLLIPRFPKSRLDAHCLE